VFFFGGNVFLFVGVTALKGGSLSELPKSIFQLDSLEIDHLGGWFFFQFWRLEMKQIDQKHPREVDEETSGKAMLM
jgi:hypothetical protein